MKKLISVIIMLVMIFSFCIFAYADNEEDTPADDPVLPASENTWGTVWDSDYNQYSVYGYTSVYGNNVETGTWYGNIIAGDGRTETVTYVIAPMTKTYGAHYVVSFWIGADAAGDIDHSAAGLATDTYIAAYYGYTKTPLGVSTSHKFACNGAYWVSGTSY